MEGRDHDTASLTALDPETVANVVESGPLGAILSELDAVFVDADHDVTLMLDTSTYMAWKQSNLSEEGPSTKISFRVDKDAEELQQAVQGFPPDLEGFSHIDAEDMVASDLHLTLIYNKTFPVTVPVEVRYEVISIHLPTEDAVQNELDGMSLFE
jgi:hypothetical protein